MSIRRRSVVRARKAGSLAVRPLRTYEAGRTIISPRARSYGEPPQGPRRMAAALSSRGHEDRLRPDLDRAQQRAVPPLRRHLSWGVGTRHD